VGDHVADGRARPRATILLSSFVANDEGLTFSAATADDPRVVDLLVDGRRIWSFLVGDATRPDPETDERRMAWPVFLPDYLHGVGEFTLRRVDRRLNAQVEDL
jgi:hypothetical protein